DLSFEESGWWRADPLQAGVAGTGVIDRDADAIAQRLDRPMQRTVIGHRSVFGDLEEDLAVGHRQDCERLVAAHEELGRDVETYPCPGSKPGRGRKGAPQTREFELGVQPECRRLREPLGGAAAIIESRQRLVADDTARRELDDRLEDRREAPLVDDRAQLDS